MISHVRMNSNKILRHNVLVCVFFFFSVFLLVEICGVRVLDRQGGG